MAVAPGENLAYVKELIKRYEASVRAVKKAECSEDITKQERLTQPLLKEMQLAMPRVWDDFIRTTSNRRQEIREGK
jgi:hypothetical protein